MTANELIGYLAALLCLLLGARLHDLWAGRELRLTRRRNRALRTEIRFLHGLQPKGTDDHVTRLVKENVALQRKNSFLRDIVRGHQRRNLELRETLVRVKAEREALRLP